MTIFTRSLALAALFALAALVALVPQSPAWAGDEHDHDHDAQATASEDEHPDEAVCRTCEIRGSVHGKEKVVAHRAHEGATYYFCSNGCAEAFDAFPEAYAVHPLPRPAPEVTLNLLDGDATALSTLKGRPVLIDFWATWCKPCEKVMPSLSDLQDRFGDELRVVGISIDEKGEEHVRKFLAKRPAHYEIALDNGESPAWHALAVAAIPAMFLIDADGQIVAEWRGHVDTDDVVAHVEALVGS